MGALEWKQSRSSPQRHRRHNSSSISPSREGAFQERKGSMFLSARSVIEHLPRRIKTICFPRRRRAPAKKTAVDHYHPDRGDEGGAPSLDKITMLGEEGTITPHHRQKRLMMISPVACYREKLWRHDSQSGSGSRPHWDPTTVRWILMTI